MAGGARVDSLDVMRSFKTVLWKFQESCVVALGDAESEMQRTLIWLDMEQTNHWKTQIRLRQDVVERAKDDLRQKKVFFDSTGRPRSAVEEEKALQDAQRRLAEAEAKLVNVRRWTRALQKEVEHYKGAAQRFSGRVNSDIPAAAAHLESLLAELEAYVALDSPGYAGNADGGGGSMSNRGQGPEGSMGLGAGGLRAGGAHRDAAWAPAARVAVAGPEPQERAEAPAVAELKLSVPALPGANAAAVERIKADRSWAALETKVFMTRATAEAAPLVFHRADPADVEDSGWRVAAGTSPVSEWNTLTLAEFAVARPDLRNLLGLPIGFSFIIGAEGIEAVIDAQGQDVWPGARDEAAPAPAP